MLAALAGERRFGFSLERAIFLTVLHRLFAPGSDRAAEKWKDDYAIPRPTPLELHHLYRAMAWLGELPTIAGRGAHAFAAAHPQGPHRGGAVRAAPRSVQRAGPRVLRHHVDLLRGRGRRDDRPVRALQGSSSGPEADGGGHGAGPRGPADLQRAVAGQHGRREEPGAGRRSAAQRVQGRTSLHRRRPRDDQPGDDRRNRSSAAGSTSSACACAVQGGERSSAGARRPLRGSPSEERRAEGSLAAEGQGSLGRGSPLRRLPQRGSGHQGSP